MVNYLLWTVLGALFIWGTIRRRQSIYRTIAEYRDTPDTVSVVWQWHGFAVPTWLFWAGMLLIVLLPTSFVLIVACEAFFTRKVSAADMPMLAMYLTWAFEAAMLGTTPTLLVIDEQGLHMHDTGSGSFWHVDPWGRRIVAWDEVERFWWIGKDRRDVLGLRIRISDRPATGPMVYNFRISGMSSETTDAIERMLREHAHHAVAT